MLRKILGVVLGLIAAMFVVIAVEAMGHQLFPPPPGNYADPAVQRALIADAPIGSLLLVIFGYGLGVLVGGAVAAFVARHRGWPAWAVAGINLALTLVNVSLLPHPIWFTATAVAVIVAAGWFAGRTFGPPPTAPALA